MHWKSIIKGKKTISINGFNTSFQEKKYFMQLRNE